MTTATASFPIRTPLTTSPDAENTLPPENSGGCEFESEHVAGLWWVWKFGGSSVASYERMIQVVNLICDQLRQWELEPQPVLPEMERQLPFLASSPSPTLSRHESQNWSTLATNEPSITLAHDHLAVISSAVGGVTDLLALSIQKASSVINCQDGVETLDLAHKSKLINEEGFYERHQKRLDCKSRLSFMLEAKAEVRRWSDDTNLIAQLENCCHSHIFAPPLIRTLGIHMSIADSIRSQVEENSAGNSSTNSRKRVPELETFQRHFFNDLINVVCILQTVALTGSVPDAIASQVLGQGEIWAVRLLHIILSRVLQAQHPDVVPLMLNAREVLTLRRTETPGDARPPMVRKQSPCRSSALSLTEGNKSTEKTASSCYSSDHLSYNPSRKSLLAEQAANACSKTYFRWYAEESEGDDQTEEYAIGPPGLEAADGEAGFVPVDDMHSTWAFPPWKSLSPKLYPPAGPVSVLRNDANHGGLPVIDWHASYKLLAKWFSGENSKRLQKKQSRQGSLTSRSHRSVGSYLAETQPELRYILLITGFVCKTLDGKPATLQRNGSDTSAVAFASLLRAQGVTIWSDVAGVYTGDPRYVAESEPLEYLSYEEALELAGIGAKVLHPASLLPCMHLQMPMLLKSSLQPEAKGTLIADFSHLRDDATLGKIVCTVSDVALLTLSNYPLTSVYRFASRFFETVEKGGGKLLLVSQGASSSAISVAVHASEVDGVLCAVQEEFRHDVEDFGSHLKVTVDPSCSVLSVVGRGQTGYVGALAAWCNALKEHNISIKAISQSSNELSTSFVVCKSQELAGLAALHSVVTSIRIGKKDP